jgi:hypothetical protein
MREQMIELLAAMMQNNMGNKISLELASGILTSFNQQWMAAEEKENSSPDKAES